MNPVFSYKHATGKRLTQYTAGFTLIPLDDVFLFDLKSACFYVKSDDLFFIIKGIMARKP
jgi:hypothetical protein